MDELYEITFTNRHGETNSDRLGFRNHALRYAHTLRDEGYLMVEVRDVYRDEFLDF